MAKPFSITPDNCVQATKSDTVTFAPGSVYVGIGGTAVIMSAGGNTGIFYCPAGTTIPVQATRVFSTGTTASGFVIMN